MKDEDAIASVSRAARAMLEEIDKVVIGKRDAAERLVVALLADGHVLIEDVPGVGKTTLARALAGTLGGSFSRIQCTPDLLPSDVVGVQVFDRAGTSFEFRPGPIVANVVLVDEINRATPRTQSALLEAMQERQLTVDRETLPLPEPFLVIATQNPVEMAGTYPLPEASLDRFLVRVRLGYPSAEDESRMLRRNREVEPAGAIARVVSTADWSALRQRCRAVHVDPDVERYLLAIARATREDHRVELGASPRAALGLYAASQALAAVRGRGYVIPDDVKELAGPVLAHRIVLASEEGLRGGSAEAIVAGIVGGQEVPVGESKP